MKNVDESGIPLPSSLRLLYITKLDIIQKKKKDQNTLLVY